MANKTSHQTSEPLKAVRTFPVDQETVDRVKALQEEFTNRTGGRVSQTVITNKAVAKVTLADIMPNGITTRR